MLWNTPAARRSKTLVTTVTFASPINAVHAGLRPGMIITAVGYFLTCLILSCLVAPVLAQSGQPRLATIELLLGFGLFCRLVELPAEGLVHVTSLGNDYFYKEGETREITVHLKAAPK